jgi:hypothetical protein
MGVARSGRFWDVVRHKQLSSETERKRVSATLVIAELYEQGVVVKLLYDRANRPRARSDASSCERKNFALGMIQRIHAIDGTADANRYRLKIFNLARGVRYPIVPIIIEI